MQKIKDFVAWFNAVPGRKRGVAVVLLSAATGLQTLGHQEWASALTTANDWIQTTVVPGMDILGAIVGLYGLVHPFFEGHASNK